MMSRKEMAQYIQKAVEERTLRPEDIPDLNLYVDQILTLFEDKAGEKAKGEKILTKSMVNNYVKEKLILPVQGKKYSRQQVLQLLYIFHLKNTLSIGEIRQVMQAMQAGGCTEKDMEQVLQAVPDARERGKLLAADLANNGAETPLSPNEAAAALLEISELSSVLKQAAQAIAENLFIQEAEEGQEREKLKEKRHNKKEEQPK